MSAARPTTTTTGVSSPISPGKPRTLAALMLRDPCEPSFASYLTSPAMP